MNSALTLDDIKIRTVLQPGDLGYIVFLHGDLYGREYNYPGEFEVYVARGLIEFYQQYDPLKDCVWICEHDKCIIGFMLLMHRDASAQLRFFIVQPACRGIGLGNKLMQLFIDFIRRHNYTSAFLWTTNELPVAAYLYKKYGFKLSEEKASTHLGKAVIEQRYDLIL